MRSALYVFRYDDFFFDSVYILNKRVTQSIIPKVLRKTITNLSGQPVCRPRFEPGASRMRSRSNNHSFKRILEYSLEIPNDRLYACPICFTVHSNSRILLDDVR